MKLLILATKILWCIAANGFMIVYVGLWWNTKLLPSAHGVEGNLFLAVLTIIVFGLFAIDGYRKYYIKGQKLYFSMSSISPLVFSLPGFIFGLYVVYFGK